MEGKPGIFGNSFISLLLESSKESLSTSDVKGNLSVDLQVARDVRTYDGPFQLGPRQCNSTQTGTATKFHRLVKLIYQEDYWIQKSFKNTIYKSSGYQLGQPLYRQVKIICIMAFSPPILIFCLLFPEFSVATHSTQALFRTIDSPICVADTSKPIKCFAAISAQAEFATLLNWNFC